MKRNHSSFDNMRLLVNPLPIGDILIFGPKLKTKTVMFLGHCFYEPNAIAVRLIAEKIFPKLKNVDEGVKFLIVGDCPEFLRKKYAKKNLIFTGPVKNLNTIYKNVSLCICPLTVGSGTRVKLLNYFAAGKPTISTRLGAEGIDVKNNKELVLENDINKYPHMIAELLQDETKSIELGKNARIFVERNHDWEKIGRNLANLYVNLLI